MSVKWSDEEIEILKENYYKGVDIVSNLLTNRTKVSIKNKAKRLKLKVDLFLQHNNLEYVKKIISESYSFSEMFKKMNRAGSGESYKVFKKAIERYDIDISHFNKNSEKFRSKKLLKDIMIENSNYDTTKLKERLYEEGLKDRKCEMCGQGEDWNGKHMSLILDHINGIRTDHRLINLRIVCPNCNATLDTHGGKNTKEQRNKIKNREW